jgi:hypothetical protein
VKQVSGRELAQVIQRRGWTLARVHGSHHVFTGLPTRTDRDSDPRKSVVKKGIASLTHEDRRPERRRIMSERICGVLAPGFRWEADSKNELRMESRKSDGRSREEKFAYPWGAYGRQAHVHPSISLSIVEIGFLDDSGGSSKPEDEGGKSASGARQGRCDVGTV